MATRNLNPYTFFEQLAANHKPRFAFGGKSKAQFNAWKRTTLPRVMATLGKKPARVPMNPELLVRWSEDGLVKERWIIDVQPGLSATLNIFRPDGLKRGERRPAILANHGHGPLGKHGPMGIAPSPESRENIKQHNYDYGLQMAKKGFVTYAIDLLGFGERDAAKKPHYSSAISVGGGPGRDPCNVYYLCATMLGTTVVAMNCSDTRLATDFVCEQSYVDGTNLGVMGLSLGGTMTTFMALYDKRFKAVDIICYAGPWHEIAFRTYNVCGSQLTPGIYDLVDVVDLQGLIAPRPLLMELGIFDSCFEANHSLKNYKQVEKLYTAAGAEEVLELDIFPDEHGWGGNKSDAFFRKYLGCDWD